MELKFVIESHQWKKSKGRSRNAPFAAKCPLKESPRGFGNANHVGGNLHQMHTF